MHVRGSHGVLRLAVVGGLVWLALLLLGTMETP
jgi:hypothetical protein